MADQAINPLAIPVNGAAVAQDKWVALTTANDGVLNPPNDAELVLLFKFTASGGGTATIKAGAGALKASQGDLLVTTDTQNHERAVFIESSRFKAQTGSDKGKVRIKASANLSVLALKQP